MKPFSILSAALILELGALGAGTLGITAILGITDSWGATSKWESPAVKTCRLPFKEVLYSAKFAPDLRIQLGHVPTDTGKRRLLAQIISPSGECQAICHLRGMEKLERSTQISALQLSCHSNKLGALWTPARLEIVSTPNSAPAIEFGSWLTGYTHAALTVEKNRVQ